MLRQLINRKQVPYFQSPEEDSYFPIQPTNNNFSREPSTSFKPICLRNFACLDTNTNKLYLNLDTLQEYREDKLNFIGVLGCDLNSQKQSLVDISEQPLIIINGVSYFLLVSESCSTEVTKLLYPLCQSIYLNENMLSQVQSSMTKCLQIGEAWDVRNFMYVVSRNLYESESLFQTAAETKQLQQSDDQSYFCKGSKGNRTPSIPQVLLRFFSQCSFVNSHSISSYDPTILKQNTELEYNEEISRWYSYDSIVKGCSKLFGSGKLLSLADFHKANAQSILEELEKRVIGNYQMFALQIFNFLHMNIYDLEMFDDAGVAKEDKQKQKEREKEREKLRQKEKERMKKVKRNMLLPFNEVEDTWLGRSQFYKARHSMIKQRIDEECDKMYAASKQKYENKAAKELEREIEQQKSLDILGKKKYENSAITFQNYFSKIKLSLRQIIQKSISGRKWKGKDKPITNNSQLLANLSTRIEINEKKKEGIEQAVNLALQEQDYLNELVFSIKNKKKPYEIVT